MPFLCVSVSLCEAFCWSLRVRSAVGLDQLRQHVLAEDVDEVLLVEDEDPVRRVTARALRRRGFGVLEARDGREALDLWEEHAAAVDMVLTDLVMPRVGGEELARQLLEAHPGLPILFMTGYTRGAALNREALGPGAEVVHKPFDADALAERIARMLERE